VASIKAEAKRNSKLNVDFDNYRNLYREVDGLSEVIFPGFKIEPYELNMFRLLSDSKQVPFQPRWHQRPDYTSFDYYNSVIFWPIILYVNNTPSIEDYKDLDVVLIPSYDLILSLVKEKISQSEIETIVPPSTFSEKQASYYKLYPLDSKDINKLKANSILEDPFPPLDEEGEPVTDDDDNLIDGGVLNPDGTVT